MPKPKRDPIMKWDGKKLTKVALPKTPKKRKRVTDKQRLDWIQRNAWEFFHDGEDKLWKIYLNRGGKIAQSGTLRQAIDFAISRSL